MHLTISKTSMVTPHFFAFLAKVDHCLSAWQVLKKSVCGNVLGTNVLNVNNFSSGICFVDTIFGTAFANDIYFKKIIVPRGKI